MFKNIHYIKVYCCLSKFIYFDLFERQSNNERVGGRRKGRERQKREKWTIHSLVHPPNGCSSQGWARPKPTARKSILVYHMGGRNPNIGGITRCLPGNTLADS